MKKPYNWETLGISLNSITPYKTVLRGFSIGSVVILKFHSKCVWLEICVPFVLHHCHLPGSVTTNIYQANRSPHKYHTNPVCIPFVLDRVQLPESMTTNFCQGNMLLQKYNTNTVCIPFVLDRGSVNNSLEVPSVCETSHLPPAKTAGKLQNFANSSGSNQSLNKH